MQMLVWHLLFESCHATRQQRGDRPFDANLTCDTGTSSRPAAASCGIVISARTLRMTRRAWRAPSFVRRLLLRSKCEPSKVTEGPRDWSVSPSLRGHQPAVIRTGQNAEEVERTSTLKDGDPNYIMLIGWVHAVLPRLLPRPVKLPFRPCFRLDPRVFLALVDTDALWKLEARRMAQWPRLRYPKTFSTS